MDLSRYTEPLSLTPLVLRTVIEGRPDTWLDARHAAEVYSPREVIAHLVLVDRDWGWLARIEKILDPAYDEDTPPLAEQDYAKQRSVEELLDEFDAVRSMKVEQLLKLGLTESDLHKSTTDEEFGTETIANILAAWVTHDLYHLGMIFKSFASLWTEEIGPYQAHLNLPNFN
ncbi:MAG: DinB family protein [Fimbriimonadia bacterium]|nr:DinB family protein [Fimbriimonadia bacterium]